MLLQVAHRRDLLHRERQDHEPGHEREGDDREAPGEADVVVEEADHRVRGVDQRLQDVRERNHAATPPWSCSQRAAEEFAVGELIDAPVAPRVAARESPRRDDRAAHDPELTHRLHGVGGAGRVVLAAGGDQG